MISGMRFCRPVAVLVALAILAGSAWAQEEATQEEATQEEAASQDEATQEEATQEEAASQDEATQEEATQEEAASQEEATQEEAASQDEATQEEAAQEEAAPLAERGYALEDVVLGDEDAPVTMIEYASFTCSHCASFHANTYPQVKSEYIDTGKVRFILREVYFDGEGLLAGRMARCAGPKGYHALVDQFFETQGDWISSPDIPKELYRVAVRAGVPSERLKACVKDKEFALSLLESYQSHAERDDINATPTILVGDERIEGARDFEVISEAVERALEN